MRRIARDVGSPSWVAGALGNLATVAADRASGDVVDPADRAGRLAWSETAVRLWAAEAALREAIQHPLSAERVLERDRRIAPVRASLGEAVFVAAWEAGRSRDWLWTVADTLDVTG